MIVVIDASVLLKGCLPDPDNDAAERLLAGSAEFHAPDTLRADLAEALRRRYEQGTIAARHIAPVLAELDRIIARWHPAADLVAGSLAEAIARNHPLADILYLTLARKLRAPFITANETLLAVLPYGSATALAEWAE